ncbi:uncharacterized protein LOC127863352 isoform X7 [Dreissena polymorpha]|uniref:uncharacterized protein LOC127863352 isoform X7 n=1 Tax=Dreissena polymorpha TaxID=45954 RepID=UPI0022645CAE|nr:uncharacterized protein LOC127863352 isoform X7 [Dreissena polymorpha]
MTAEALSWDSAPSNLRRFNEPIQPMQSTTFGFQGYPENNFIHAKRPLKHMPSADITTDVNRYFRRDSPTEFYPPANQAPPPRMQTPPPPQQDNTPDWLQSKEQSGVPPLIQSTLSPRYQDESSYRKPPVIRDPLREMTSAEKRKKIEEHYIAEQDRAEARRRKEDAIREKREDIQKARQMIADHDPYGKPGGGAPRGADNRKKVFTELQMNRPPGSPKYSDPGLDLTFADKDQEVPLAFRTNRSEAKYGDENRDIDRTRSSMDQIRNGFPEKKEGFGRAATMPVKTSYSDSFGQRNHDMLRQQEREIEDLRRNLDQLESERRFSTNRDTARSDPQNDKMEMLENQSLQLRKMQDEINRLKAQDDMSFTDRPSDRPRYDVNPRAQSVSQEPLCVFTAKPSLVDNPSFVGYLFTIEPQTDRTGMRINRDAAYFGESEQKLPDYLTRRRPVGKFYNTNTTYTHDYNAPVVRRGRQTLENHNKEPFEPFAPWGQYGGGAPLTDSTGQRRTRIQGSMGTLGRELSDSARARRAHKHELLDTIGQQAAYERARKEAEKAYARQGFVEVADVMRQQKVGYPKYKPSGLIGNHHLPHAMSNPYERSTVSEQREYHDYLANQIEERNRNTRLGQLEEKRQAREHFKTQDAFFGRRGGGNRKGEDLRKYNLDKAIHDPQSTSQYYNKMRMDDEPLDILERFKPRITVNSTHRNLYEFPEGNVKRIDLRNYMGTLGV